MSVDPTLLWILERLPPLLARTRRRDAEVVAAMLRREAPDLPMAGGADGPMVAALGSVAAALHEAVRQTRAQFDAFSSEYFGADGGAAQRKVAAIHLRQTAARRELRGDLRALRRHLDHEALRERAQRRRHQQGLQLELCLVVLARHLGETGRAVSEATTIVPLLAEMVLSGDSAVPRLSALSALRAIAARDRSAVTTDQARTAVAAARESAPDLQVEAVLLLLEVNPEEGERVLQQRLTERPGPADDFLVRAACVRAVAERVPRDRADTLLRVSRSDPSEHVRMTLARELGRLGVASPDLLPMGAGGDDPDPSFRVRAIVCEALAGIATRSLEAGGQTALAHSALEGLLGSVSAEQHRVAQRVAAEESARCVKRLVKGDAWARGWAAALVGGLVEMTRRADPPVAFLVSNVVVELRPLLDPQLAAAQDSMIERLNGLDSGKGRRVTLPAGLVDPQQIGELLASFAAAGFGFSATRRGRGLRVRHGDRRERSLARMLHEVRHRSPYKRQAGAHTTLPRWRGSLRAPPAGMAAINPTGVPGEPVVSGALGTWGPHLPTVADCLEVARSGRAIQIFHSFGTTVLSPPSWMRRVQATWTLRWTIGRMEALRQRSLDAQDTDARAAFVSELRRLGFRIDHRAGVVACDDRRFELGHPVVEQSFGRGSAALLAGVPSLSGLADQAWRYVYSSSGNSLFQLAAFILGLGAVVMGDAVVQAARIRRWRRSIPLVIGGSGTRGKSGSERLKAALLHAAGCEVLCKTTGNEAMVIHSAPGVQPQEMMLYRPYDKATIWEQRDVLQLGARMGVQALLWECMALNPRYIEILALEWMRDDLTTVTNCYPDHEDVQGPAGRDVADSLGRFVPRRGVLVTSEREMLPVLRQRAQQRDTRFLAVGDRESDLISQDLLDRFPYREHPRNIAMVARLAEELGVERETAIVQMADHLVPDIGALRIFPTAAFRGRRITYINGHSANERTGFINNWTRTGLADFEPGQRRGEWIAGVINNRADRVARSRVFAGIVAGDVSAHVLCLIGTNLRGFVGYLRRALGQYVEPFDLGADRDVARDRFGRLMGRLHLPAWSPEDLNAEVISWLQGCGVALAEANGLIVRSGFADAAGAAVTALPFGGGRVRPALDAIGKDAALRRAIGQLCDGIPGGDRGPELGDFLRRQVAITAAVAAAARAVEASAGSSRLSRGIGQLFVELTLERTRRLKDARATGDQVLDFVCSQIPPGVHARVMGMQNIKGTGLDFVYRWLSLERVTGRLQSLEDADHDAAVELLRSLRGHPDYGVLDARLAHAEVPRIVAERFAGHADVQDEASATTEHLAAVVVARERSLAAGRRRLSPVGLAARLVENALDYLHSIHRRRAAGRVFDDLVHQRISHARAAAMLRELNAVQKGGWLSKRPGR